MKGNGLRIEEMNSNWTGDDHEIDRERLLFRLTRIAAASQDGGCFGSNTCQLCTCHTPYGSHSFGGVEWQADIAHYIEFHGHKPTDNELQAINFKFEEIKSKTESIVREGLLWRAQQKKMAEVTK